MIGQTIRHYKILSKLGEGGMGVVYLAEDTRLERKVALKFLPLHYTADPLVNARFQREAKAAAALNHPNIITVYEIGDHEGRAYIAMEYIDGQSLRQITTAAAEGGGLALPLEQNLNIISQVCEGLAKAHQAGIVHRDLKPENLMIDADGKVKILDFGLAQMKGRSRLTFDKSTLGTIFYMSPEQCEGAEVDHRTDIWAVGVMLYEMLTGKLPFEGEYEAAIMYSIVNQAPVPLARHKAGVSPDLQRIVDKALDKDRETRYQGISELLTDLDRVKKSESVSAKPMSRLKKRQIARAFTWYGAFVGFFALLAVAAFYFLGSKPVKRLPVEHKQVTFVGDASSPEISPDGQFVAYARGKTGDQKIFVEDLANSRALDISSETKLLGFFKWLPNGAELSFLGVADSFSFATYVVPRLGGNARRTTINANSSWSPDGAYSASANTNWKGISIITTATDRFLTNIPLKGTFHALWTIEWSPLSNRLLFVTQGDEQHTIYTIKIDGSEQQKVVEDVNPISSPRWAAHGQAIYYFRAVGRTKQLMKVNISTKTGKAESEPEILQSGMEAGEIFSISRDNKRLFYTRELRYSNLWLVDLKDERARQGLRPKQLTTGTLDNFAPSFSPNGQKIAFSVAKREHANIHVMSVEGGQIQQLTHISAFNANPAWSPDGREIAFASWQEKETRVWKINAEGGQLQPFSNTKLSFNLGLTWFPGQDILYQRPGNRNFYKLNPQTEAENPLVLNESVGWIFNPIYSPDGKSVAIHRNMQFEQSQSGLWQISLGDSSQKLLQKSWFDFLPIAWSADGKWIYALFTEKTPNAVLKIPVKGGEAKSVFALPVDEIDGITMTPDGRRLVYAAVERKSDVWVMEHFDPENELDRPITIPDSPEMKQLTYQQKGASLLEQRKYAEAEEAFREGLKLNAKHVELLSSLGWSLQRQMKYAEAKEVFLKGLAINPQDGAILERLGESNIALANYDAAQQCFEKLMTVDRKLGQWQLGNIEFLRKNHAAAERHFREVLSSDSTYAQAYRSLGYLFAEQKRFEEAKTFAQKAVSINPNYFPNDNLMAWVFVMGEFDLDRGIALAEKASAIKPGLRLYAVKTYSYIAIPEHTLGLAYFKKGDYEKAVQYLEQAAAFVPEREAIRDDLRRARESRQRAGNQ